MENELLSDKIGTINTKPTSSGSMVVLVIVKLGSSKLLKRNKFTKVGSKSNKFDHKLAEHCRGLAAKNIKNTYKTSSIKCVI